MQKRTKVNNNRQEKRKSRKMAQNEGLTAEEKSAVKNPDKK